MFVVKECSKCKEYKMLDEFNIGNRLFGRYSYCKNCTRKQCRDRYEANLELRKQQMRDYSKRTYLRDKDKKNQYRKKKRLNDGLFRLRKNTSCLIRNAIVNFGSIKKSRAYEILGCDFETFKLHVEKQFTNGMTWDNYGEWHLDHIYPVSLAKDEQHLIELNHYTNFQPLWAKDNISKGNKVIEKQLFLL